MLFFCFLLQADELVALYYRAEGVVSGIELAASGVAAVTALRLPRFVGAVAWEFDDGRVPGGRALSGHRKVRDRAASQRSLVHHYEHVKLQLLTIEDDIRRGSWMQQSRVAIQQLNEILLEIDSVVGERPSGSATDKPA
jgi:hypothetical protein